MNGIWIIYPVVADGKIVAWKPLLTAAPPEDWPKGAKRVRPEGYVDAPVRDAPACVT